MTKESKDITQDEEEQNISKETTTTFDTIKALASDDEPKKGANITLREILGGDILTKQIIRSQIGMIVLIVVITIIYIGNRYGSQKEMIEIDKLTRELQDAKYKALSSSSTLTERCRESRVLEVLQNNKDSVLHIADQPPFIINLPEE
jgi:hypothetical protein